MYTSICVSMFMCVLCAGLCWTADFEQIKPVGINVHLHIHLRMHASTHAHPRQISRL